MALNETRVLRNMELRLGFKFVDLELEADDILDTIKMNTLPLYSKYMPYTERVYLKNKVDGYSTRYWLDTDLDVLNVNRVFPLDTFNLPGNGGGGLSQSMAGAGLSPKMGMGTSGGSNMVDSATQADQASYNNNPITFKFFFPKQIELSQDMGNGQNIMVEVNTVHPENFSTIPTNMQTEFLNLALADVSEALLAIRTRFQNLQTSYGAMDLNIDLLQSNIDARQDIVERLRASVLRVASRKKVYMA